MGTSIENFTTVITKYPICYLMPYSTLRSTVQTLIKRSLAIVKFPCSQIWKIALCIMHGGSGTDCLGRSNTLLVVRNNRFKKFGLASPALTGTFLPEDSIQ